MMRRFNSNFGGKTVWFDLRDVVSMERCPEYVRQGIAPGWFTPGMDGYRFEAYTRVTLRNRQEYHVLETPEQIMKGG